MIKWNKMIDRPSVLQNRSDWLVALWAASHFYFLSFPNDVEWIVEWIWVTHWMDLNDSLNGSSERFRSPNENHRHTITQMCRNKKLVNSYISIWIHLLKNSRRNWGEQCSVRHRDAVVPSARDFLVKYYHREYFEPVAPRGHPSAVPTGYYLPSLVFICSMRQYFIDKIVSQGESDQSGAAMQLENERRFIRSSAEDGTCGITLEQKDN